MGWLQLKLATTSEHASRFEEALETAGALSVSFDDLNDDPILEPGVGETPLWPEVVLTGLWEDDADEATIEIILRGTLGDQLPSLQWERLEDRAWEREWLQYFQPIKFGDTLWVCPSGHELPDDGAAIMHLDPGLAFGTGTHPTTALCLEWLAQHPPVGGVIDFGCGSGILAIAALILGADHAWAVDIDPQAVVATLDNAERNQIASERLSVGLPETLHSVSPQPLLLANILAQPLIELAAQLAAHVSLNGVAVLSGILNEQADAVIDAWLPWFSVMDVARQGDWCRISLRRNGTTASEQ